MVPMVLRGNPYRGSITPSLHLHAGAWERQKMKI